MATSYSGIAWQPAAPVGGFRVQRGQLRVVNTAPQQQLLPSEAGVDERAAAPSRRSAVSVSRARGLELLPYGALTQDQLRAVTHLGLFDVTSVIELLAQHASVCGTLDRRAFSACFELLRQRARRMLRRVDHAALRALRRCGSSRSQVLARLFVLFDPEGCGTVDFAELASGLSCLVKKGQRTEKARATFALYDYAGDGYIDLQEMTSYLASVFKVAYLWSPAASDFEATNGSPDELAASTARQAFDEAGVPPDGRLSLGAFEAWCGSGNKGDSDGGGGAGAGGEECAICLNVLQEPRTLPCGHRFCTGCVNGMLQHGIGAVQVCPLCRGPIPNQLSRRHDDTDDRYPGRLIRGPDRALDEMWPTRTAAWTRESERQEMLREATAHYNLLLRDSPHTLAHAFALALAHTEGGICE